MVSINKNDVCMHVRVYEQDNREKNLECLPVTVGETGEPP